MAKDLRDRQLIELKDTIKELNATVRNLTALLEAANKRDEEHAKCEEEYIKREKVLQEQVDFLTKKLFCKCQAEFNIVR